MFVRIISLLWPTLPYFPLHLLAGGAGCSQTGQRIYFEDKWKKSDRYV